jgi:hypothetical protein
LTSSSVRLYIKRVDFTLCISFPLNII